MKHTLKRFCSSAALFTVSVSGIMLLNGCQVFETEQEPMPPGAYQPVPAPDKAQPAIPTVPAVSTLPAGEDPLLVTSQEKLLPPPPPSAVKKSGTAKSAPAKTAAAKIAVKPASSPKDGVYVVKKGDSYWLIAKRFGISRSALIAANGNLDPNKPLLVGTKLTIPAAAVKSAAPAKAAAGTSVGGKYVVQKGDSFYKIAHKFGVRATDIAQANNMKLETPLIVGKTLVIPGKNGKVQSAPAANVAPKAKKSVAAAKGKKKAEGKKTNVSAKPAADAKKDAVLPPPPTAPAAAPATPAAPAAPTAPAAPAVPAAPAAVAPAAPAVPAAPAIPAAEEGFASKLSKDMTMEEVARDFGCTLDEVKRLNPNLPATGKIKAGTFVKFP